jgi:hypothetical protein
MLICRIVTQGAQGWNLAGKDLSNADLRQVDFSNANLRHANLSESNLRKANLANADLRHANLNKTNLEHVNLSQSNLCQASLIEANLWEAQLQQANLSMANLSGANLSSTNLKEAKLEQTDLRGATMPDGTVAAASAVISSRKSRNIIYELTVSISDKVIFSETIYYPRTALSSEREDEYYIIIAPQHKETLLKVILTNPKTVPLGEAEKDEFILSYFKRMGQSGVLSSIKDVRKWLEVRNIACEESTYHSQ